MERVNQDSFHFYRINMRIPRPQVFEKMVKVISIDGFLWSLGGVQVKGILQRGLVVLDKLKHSIM